MDPKYENFADAELPAVDWRVVLKALASILRQARRQAAVYIVLNLAVSILELANLLLMFPLVYTLTDAPLPKSLPLPGAAAVLEWFAQMSNDARVLMVGILLAVLTLARAGMSYFATRAGADLLLATEYRQRTEFMSLLLRLDLVFFSQFKSGQVFQILSNFTVHTAMLASYAVALVAPSVMLVVFAVTAIYTSTILALFAMAGIGVLMLSTSGLLRIVRKRATSTSSAYLELNQNGFELVQAVRLIKAVAAEKLIEEKYASQVAASQVHQASVERIKAIIGPVSMFAPQILLAALLIIAAVALPGGGGEPWTQNALVFLAIMARLTGPAAQINSLRTDIANAWPNVRILLAFKSTAEKNLDVTGSKPIERINQDIVFEQVDFAFALDRAPTLTDLDLRINRGKVTAIVGGSGAGKTTLVNLLAGIYRPTSGSIKHGADDLAALSGSAWRRRIGYVSQDVFLMNDTIASNIRFGAPEKSLDEVREAARRAGALEFIEEMQYGFETIVGDRGLRLSGGQAQRVAIARAFLRDPDLLILDEATSALDTLTEIQVQTAIAKLMHDRTVVVIAHRLSTIRDADRICVLGGGRVLESGDHESLMELRGAYYEYVAARESSQTSGENESRKQE